MAAKRSKRGQFQKRRSSRRRKPKFDLMGAVQTVILGNVLTTNAFSLNAWDFLTNNETAPTKGTRGGSNPALGMQVTLKELLTEPFAGANGDPNFTNVDIVWQNMKTNAVPLLTQMIGIPIGFKVIRKLSRKPILNPLNRALKMAGMNDVKVG